MTKYEVTIIDVNVDDFLQKFKNFNINTALLIDETDFLIEYLNFYNGQKYINKSEKDNEIYLNYPKEDFLIIKHDNSIYEVGGADYYATLQIKPMNKK